MTRAAASRFKVADAAPVFAALGDPTRLHIVVRLCEGGPQSIVDLTDGAKVSRQAIRKHLHALEQAGLVQGVRDGREHIWEIQPRRLTEAQHYLDQISEQWDAAIGRLRAFVETDD